MYYIFVLVLSLIHLSYADLPIHCLRSQVLGRWKWELTQSSDDKQLSCGHPDHDTNRDELTKANTFQFQPYRVLDLSISYPNRVSNHENGDKGTFTMVFDEAIEIRISGQVIFAKFRYGLKNGNPDDENIPAVTDLQAYESFCDQTSIGWYHDESNNNWGCVRGRQLQSEHKFLAKPFSNTLITKTNFFDRQNHVVKYEPDLDLIESINSNPASLWKAGINEVFVGKSLFSVNRMLGRRRYHKPALFRSKTKLATGSNTDLPDSVDWRYIDSPVRNQGQCGSCYVFSTLSMLETRARIANPDKDLADLHYSEQDVLACSRYNEGCEGGYPYLVAKYAHEFGVIKYDDNQYTGYNSMCPDRSIPKQTQTMSSNYHYVGGYFGSCSEEAMMKEIAFHGPVVAAIQVPTSLMLFRSGIFDDCPRHVRDDDGYEQSDHAIVVVGYGEENGVKYWIIRNSWGSEYGENGYFRLLRGIDACGIESSGVTSYS